MTNNLDKIIELARLMQDLAKLNDVGDENLSTELLLLIIDVISIRDINNKTILSYTISNTENETRFDIGTGFTKLNFTNRDRIDKKIKEKLLKYE